MEYFKVKIVETGRSNPKQDIEENQRFNTIDESFATIEEVKAYLIEHYGKLPIPNESSFIYNDKSGEKPIGFVRSFWNKDYSHNSKSWWQTDWITVTQCTETSVNYWEG